MVSGEDAFRLSPTPPPMTTRHRCAACFKQYKKKEHLIEHMKTSYHSVHQPKCGVCQKYCRSFQSLREHIHGPLSKSYCSSIFAEKGCILCLEVFDSVDSLAHHNSSCQLRTPLPLDMITTTCALSEISSLSDGGHKAVAIACEMVGGGSNASLDLCARVCLVDEDEQILFHTYVLPQIPVTDYRFEVTGIREEHLRDAMPLVEVQEKILQILYNGESIERTHGKNVPAKVLVGHNLEYDLDCLRLNYPEHLLRDTAKYQPLMKTNLVSYSLKYLTKTYLGYEIQNGVHDPYKDCAATTRLYKGMRFQDHQTSKTGHSLSPIEDSRTLTRSFNSLESEELDQMTPDELFRISESNYRCWCLDSHGMLL